MSIDPKDFELSGAFYLGGHINDEGIRPTLLDSRDLRTHGVCVGMTGSGKTGLGIILLEEAAMDGIPSIVIDPKGDMGNLLLTFDELSAEQFEPWIPAEEANRKGTTVAELAAKTASTWKRGLAEWGQDADRIKRLRSAVDMQIFTPGSSSGRPISLLEDFTEPGDDILREPDVFRDLLLSTTESLLALIGENGDPIQNPANILISSILQYYWELATSPSLVDLIRAVQSPPFVQIGVIDVDTMFPPKDRMKLAMSLNALAASPAFAAWMDGEPLNIDKLLFSPEGKPRVSVLNIAHLSENERMFFVTRFYNDLLSWTRRQTGTSALRAIVYMDEVAGYLPPVAQPPSKRPILSLLKQARAYGVGLIMATQNPADLDYKALSNMGTWMIGRLQTSQDRDRLLDGMSLDSAKRTQRKELDRRIAELNSREFVLHSAHTDEPEVFRTRWAMSYLRGPLTRREVRRLVDERRLQTADATVGSPTDLAEAALEASSSIVEDASANDSERLEAGTARPATGSSATRSSGGRSITAGARPLLDHNIDVYFLPVRVAEPANVQLLAYRPMLYADAVVNFTKEGASRTLHLVTTPSKKTGRVDWSGAAQFTLSTEDLSREPAQTNTPQHYLKPHRSLFRPEFYEDCESELQDWLYRNEKMKTWYNRSLREGSQPGESRESFMQRLTTLAREKRDDDVDELESKFRERFERLQDKLHMAELKAEEEAADVQAAKLNAAADIGGTFFNIFAGRKRSTRAARSSAVRLQRESAQAERAQLKVHQLSNESAKLDHGFQAELRELEARYAEMAANVETSEKAPLKRDCVVRGVVLLWVPYWRFADGEMSRAWTANAR